MFAPITELIPKVSPASGCLSLKLKMTLAGSADVIKGILKSVLWKTSILNAQVIATSGLYSSEYD